MKGEGSRKGRREGEEERAVGGGWEGGREEERKGRGGMNGRVDEGREILVLKVLQ